MRETRGDQEWFKCRVEFPGQKWLSHQAGFYDGK